MTLSSRTAVVGVALAVAFLVVMAFPGCGPGVCGADGPGVDGMLASAERWVRVLSIEGTTGEDPLEVELQVVPVDAAHREGSPSNEAVAVPSSFLSGIEDGLAAQDDVFLALASKGLERETAAYVIVRGADGGHHFVGECSQRDEDFLRESLGGRYDATIELVIGMTGRDRLERILSKAGLG